jgi:hypothetical protein
MSIQLQGGFGTSSAGEIGVCPTNVPALLKFTLLFIVHFLME